MASDTSEPTCPALPRISGATRSPSIRSDANYRERGLDRHGNPISSRRAAYKWDPTSLCLHLVSENDPFFLIKRSVPPISPGTARNGLVVVLFCFFSKSISFPPSFPSSHSTTSASLEALLVDVVSLSFSRSKRVGRHLRCTARRVPLFGDHIFMVSSRREYFDVWTESRTVTDAKGRHGNGGRWAGD